MKELEKEVLEKEVLEQSQLKDKDLEQVVGGMGIAGGEGSQRQLNDESKRDLDR